MTYITIRIKYLPLLLVMMIGLMMIAHKTLANDLRPEHPRPDIYRENWLSLNGEWKFEIDKEGDGELRGLTYGKEK